MFLDGTKAIIGESGGLSQICHQCVSAMVELEANPKTDSHLSANLPWDWDEYKAFIGAQIKSKSANKVDSWEVLKFFAGVWMALYF